MEADKKKARQKKTDGSFHEIFPEYPEFFIKARLKSGGAENLFKTGSEAPPGFGCKNIFANTRPDVFSGV
jgi:hypothetical protein